MLCGEDVVYEEDDDSDVVEYPQYTARLNSCGKDSYAQLHLHPSQSRLQWPPIREAHIISSA